ncbi:MAG: prolyl oligopeptidase family serine peptidase, partial [Caulobacteraceae bacterium]
IFTARDRIAYPDIHKGFIYNLWQDDAHIHGVWRRAAIAGYEAGSPQWETVIDLDALSKAEGRNWIWKGAVCRRPAETRCLVRLSDGGGDAVEIREFDTGAKAFVEGGFRLTTAKQDVDWLDDDTIVLDRDWGGDTVTESGYGYIIKTLKRGQPMDAATEVYRSVKTDVSSRPIVLRGEGGRTDALIAARGPSFFESEYYLLGGAAPVHSPLPAKASFRTYVDGQFVFTLDEDWNGFKSGDVAAYDLAALKRDPAGARPVLVMRPTGRQATQNIDSTDGKLVIHLFEDVKGAIDLYDYKAGAWTHTRLATPKDATVTLQALSADDDRLYFTAESFLQPTSLWSANAATGAVKQITALPPRFNASTHVVEQFWAASTDGTKIPYFLVRPKAAKLDGSTPTLMYGYGGFQNAKPPVYIPEAGKLWMERGGAYVIANIRGGSEFGPAWHQAVLREKRQLAFDDFAAVAKDLIARRITSPRHLGIYGRSNGGVLTSVFINQHPALITAAVVESPLVDMLRYHKLSAGASWTGEYGNPDVAGDYAFIARYSAYQNLKAGMKLPEPYVTTNTKDDRVHPGHARKYAAKLEALGYPVIYYEQTFGGHANDADPELNARRWARHYVYLAQKLMD